MLARALRFRHVAADPEGADDDAVVIAQGHLVGEDPGGGSVQPGLAFQQVHDRYARADDVLLGIERGLGVLVGEVVEVRLPDHVCFVSYVKLLHLTTTHTQEPALQVLEVSHLVVGGHQVVETDAVEVVAPHELGGPLVVSRHDPSVGPRAPSRETIATPVP